MRIWDFYSSSRSTSLEMTRLLLQQKLVHANLAVWTQFYAHLNLLLYKVSPMFWRSQICWEKRWVSKHFLLLLRFPGFLMIFTQEDVPKRVKPLYVRVHPCMVERIRRIEKNFMDWVGVEGILLWMRDLSYWRLCAGKRNTGKEFYYLELIKINELENVFVWFISNLIAKGFWMFC